MDVITLFQEQRFFSCRPLGDIIDQIRDIEFPVSLEMTVYLSLSDQLNKVHESLPHLFLWGIPVRHQLRLRPWQVAGWLWALHGRQIFR